ncbi:GTP pyrophosphokinase [Myceligenerans indicum]|uniref:GTP pyrophosphokinase family protein n=1 Tax=Myceligenerans indicum TaxID=2593663 RepID=A0ABS1LP55_9MICO|nr:GTP pyrophosphokinase family protein [Myceligenerans indicum]MBL0887568.1 GTP pyrophosphokinase family protein [Myceligenerans indicum]
MDTVDPSELRVVMHEVRRMALTYKFGIDEVMTKISILRDELRHMQQYNPVEHVGSRLKSLDSIVAKCRRKSIPFTPEGIRKHMFDIAGIRVTCSFVSDIYHVRDMLIKQADVTLLEERDYIATPKQNGYRSLHLILQVPVFLSDRVEDVIVEVQLRTIAMDFWASLEHKIYYKYDREVPRHLIDSLKLAADVAQSLDTSMERIHDEVKLLSGGTEPAVRPDTLLSPEEILREFWSGRSDDARFDDHGRLTRGS